ncbi:glycosyltransferase family 52 [Riemerella columbipharyngis]|nr:glycosyltransferase family 52 [Riemerella columbipharyngis]
MMKKEYKNTYIGATVYTYLLFLLYVKDEDIDKCFYFLTKDFNKELLDKIGEDGLVINTYTSSITLFENKSVFRIINRYYNRLRNVLIWNKSRFFYKKHYPFVKDTRIFTHMPPGHFLITAIVDTNDYTLIEDGLANHIQQEKQNKETAEKKKENIFEIAIELFFLRIEKYKGIASKRLAKKIFTRNDHNDPKVEVVSLQALWDNSSERKKNFILDRFCFRRDLIDGLQKRSVIVLTQPFYEDSWVEEIHTEEQKIDLYRAAIEKEGESNVIIKTHPREKTDYKKYFPDAVVVSQPIPFELLELNGLRLKKAYTISSTAALNINTPDCEIIQIETGKNLIGEIDFKRICKNKKNG